MLDLDNRERACVCGIVGIVTVGVKDKNGLLRPAEALEIGVGGYLTSGGSRRTLRGYCIFYILLSRKYAFLSSRCILFILTFFALTLLGRGRPKGTLPVLWKFNNDSVGMICS